jgi:hypothetical protein
LTELAVRFERHLAHFERGTPDETWLPLAGSNGWIVLTSDKRIRYNLLEKQALEMHAVREFVFTSGNMSGQDMAVALEQDAELLSKSPSTVRRLNHTSRRGSSSLAKELIDALFSCQRGFFKSRQPIRMTRLSWRALWKLKLAMTSKSRWGTCEVY